MAVCFKGFIACLFGSGGDEVYVESGQIHIILYGIMACLLHTKIIFVACQVQIATN